MCIVGKAREAGGKKISGFFGTTLLLDTLSWHIVMSVNIHHVQNMLKPSYMALASHKAYIALQNL